MAYNFDLDNLRELYNYIKDRMEDEGSIFSKNMLADFSKFTIEHLSNGVSLDNTSNARDDYGGEENKVSFDASMDCNTKLGDKAIKPNLIKRADEPNDEPSFKLVEDKQDKQKTFVKSEPVKLEHVRIPIYFKNPKVLKTEVKRHDDHFGRDTEGLYSAQKHLSEELESFKDKVD